MKKTLLGLAATCALAISPATFAKDNKLTLMLDWFVNPNHGPIVIAQEKGLFEQQGIEVEIQEPADKCSSKTRSGKQN
ncbi:hydroxymethylpyrimidine ABC transporter [Vibrio ishigakensis]|uniref:Hydroxymethylpyrimidine ABC transporter n=1 Tax=Vibrio ishigakensis TaxID=1481914 RepID=A0A0B8QHL1_9VIBR|nr:hydroxymethylpyrimidine ABC transporter [Vibrio ishigakensis]